MMHSLLSEVKATRAAIAQGIDIHALEKRQAATLDMQRMIKEDVLASENAMEANITKNLKKYIDQEIEKMMKLVKNETQEGVVNLIKRRDLRLNERGIPSDKVGNLFLRAKDEEVVDGNKGGVVTYDLGESAPPAGFAYINFALALKGIGISREAIHVREECLAQRLGNALKKLVPTATEIQIIVERISGGGLMVAPSLLEIQAHINSALNLGKTDLRGGVQSDKAMFMHYRAQVDVASFQEVTEAIKGCEGTCLDLLGEWKVAKGSKAGCNAGLLLGQGTNVQELKLYQRPDVHLRHWETEGGKAGVGGADAARFKASAAPELNSDPSNGPPASARVRQLLSAIDDPRSSTLGVDNAAPMQTVSSLQSDTCQNGTRQSPVDILPAVTDPMEARQGFNGGQMPNVIKVGSAQLPTIRLRYPPLESLHAINTGDGILLQYPPGLNGTATLEEHLALHPVGLLDDTTLLGSSAVMYQLRQLHLHTPSEHSGASKTVSAEVHLVHELVSAQRGAAPLLIVAVRFAEGSQASAFFSTFVDSLPPPPRPRMPANEASVSTTNFDFSFSLFGSIPGEMKPRNYYTYRGSMTASPCLEAVQWVVMRETISISKAQVRALHAAIGADNARPVQNSHWPAGSLIIYTGQP